MPDAAQLAALLSKVEALEAARLLELEAMERLRADVVRLEQIGEERDAIIQALRVTARGAS